MGAPIGNQNAKLGKRWTQAVERAIERKYGGAPAVGLERNYALDRAADDFVELLSDKNPAVRLSAFKEVGDRIEGKVVQPIQHGGPDGGLIPVEVTRDTDLARRIAWTLTNAALGRASESSWPAIPGQATPVTDHQEQPA